MTKKRDIYRDQKQGRSQTLRHDIATLMQSRSLGLLLLDPLTVNEEASSKEGTYMKVL